jgi:hypothetical protein
MHASPEIIAEMKIKLEATDSTPCHFRHHPLNSDGPDLPLCGAERNFRHGCAHAHFYVVQSVLTQMHASQIIDRSTFSNFWNRINRQHDLFRLDQVVAFDDLSDTDVHDVREEQFSIIKARAEVAKDLLEILNRPQEGQ